MKPESIPNLWLEKTFSEGAKIKDADPKLGIVTGYLSAYNFEDSDGDTIRKGAYAKTIMERGPESKGFKIKHLMNHDWDKQVGVFTLLKEDDYGLYYESKVGSWGFAQDFAKMCEDGAIDQHSIGYRVIKYNQLEEGKFELVEIALSEGSSLNRMGANMNTPYMGMKSAEALADYMTNLEYILKKATYTDETCLYLENLLTAYKSQKQITEPVIITQPQPEILTGAKFDENEFYTKLTAVL